MDAIAPHAPTTPKTKPHDPALWRAAQALEAGFIAEMLKDAKIGAARQEFGGGVGEDQFASMLQDKQADLWEQKGGFGLAENIYQAMHRNEAHD